MGKLSHSKFALFNSGFNPLQDTSSSELPVAKEASKHISRKVRSPVKTPLPKVSAKDTIEEGDFEKDNFTNENSKGPEKENMENCVVLQQQSSSIAERLPFNEIPSRGEDHSSNSTPDSNISVRATRRESFINSSIQTIPETHLDIPPLRETFKSPAASKIATHHTDPRFLTQIPLAVGEMSRGTLSLSLDIYLPSVAIGLHFCFKIDDTKFPLAFVYTLLQRKLSASRLLFPAGPIVASSLFNSYSLVREFSKTALSPGARMCDLFTSESYVRI